MFNKMVLPGSSIFAAISSVLSMMFREYITNEHAADDFLLTLFPT